MAEITRCSGEWQLRCVAYTGNNMRKSSQAKQERSVKMLESLRKYLFIPVVAQERGRHRPGPGLRVPQLRRGRAWWRGRGPRPPSHRPHQVSQAQELQIEDAEIGKRFLLVIDIVIILVEIKPKCLYFINPKWTGMMRRKIANCRPRK